MCVLRLSTAIYPRSYVSLFNTVNKVSKISFTFGINYLHAEPQLWSNLRHQSSPGCFTSVFVNIKLWKAKYSQMTGSSHHAAAVSLQSIVVIAAGLDFFKFTLVKASSRSTGCGRLENSNRRILDLLQGVYKIKECAKEKDTTSRESGVFW